MKKITYNKNINVKKFKMVGNVIVLHLFKKIYMNNYIFMVSNLGNSSSKL